MGIFYNPPPPPTANNAGTPPEPHVPIGTQGNQPPRYTTALMLVAVLAGWPADLEPRLARPNDLQKTKIAPLTLTYGQPPQPQGPLTATKYTQLVTSWPPDLEPRLARPNDQQQKIAPLTLTFGQQPQRYSVASRMASTVGAWPLDLEPRLGRPNEQQQKIAPLTLTYGTAPTPQPALTVPELTAIAASWTDAWTLPRTAPRSVPSAQAQPTYQPLARQILVAWEAPWTAPPTPVRIAPLTLPYGQSPPVVGTAGPTEYAIALAVWPLDLEPRLGAPNERRQTVAPLTLRYGDAPPIVGGSAISEATSVANWLVDAPLVQGPAKSAALAPVLSAVPIAPFQRQILTAWESPWIAPPPLVKIAPLTLVYGQPPPPQSAPNPQLAAVTAWTPDPVQPPTARAVPPLTVITRVTWAPLPALIWSAWEAAWIQPPRPVTIVALTLPFGAAPPARSGIDRQTLVRAAWDDPVSQPRPLTFIAPFTVVATVVPRTVQPLSILRAWQDDVVSVRRLTAIAPFALRSGDQPPIQGPLALGPATTIVFAWPADLEPRLASVNATQVHIGPLTLRTGDRPAPRASLSPVQMSLIGAAWQLPFMAPPPLACFKVSAAVARLAGVVLSSSGVPAHLSSVTTEARLSSTTTWPDFFSSE